ncbi:MAG: glycosyltransferase [Planctomycetota bacterium]|nr:glycosyltransferase [Planctomycetota bacterium]
MRILMLGWEFPPFIAGGLGVACHGLTKALDRMGHQVVFVLPKPVDRSHASHVKMISPGAVVPPRGSASWPAQHRNPSARSSAGTSSAETLPADSGVRTEVPEELASLPGFSHTRFLGVEAEFSHPYPAFDQPLGREALIKLGFDPSTGATDPESAVALHPDGSISIDGIVVSAPIGGNSPAGVGYGSDLVGDSDRYARLVVALARHEDFDVIHAHDWLTYPAGLALSRVTGKPLVVHVHSTEFDRAGNNVNQRVYDIERAGIHGADRVIAVSQMTRRICASRYGVPESKVDVVYNGVDREATQPVEGSRIESTDKIVLFLGRITMQKGPEYFIAAARRVLEKVENVKFVLAGSGDMAMRMIEMAAAMGIGHKVLFTGFLRGKDVERIFQMADCYVMPSVSEPFGIAALEAIHHDVPVIMSKTSGAAEVLTHVLKVDFWDIDEMANKIVAVLKYPPLSQTLRQHGSFELHRLTWEGAAQRCLETYGKAKAGLARVPA